MSMRHEERDEQPIAEPTPMVFVEYREADRRWVVRQHGATRNTSLHSRRSDAEHVARRLGRRQKKDVTVMSVDGVVEQTYTYSSLRNRSQLIRTPRGSA